MGSAGICIPYFTPVQPVLVETICSRTNWSGGLTNEQERVEKHKVSRDSAQHTCGEPWKNKDNSEKMIVK